MKLSTSFVAVNGLFGYLDSLLRQATLVAKRRDDMSLGTESQFFHLVLTVARGRGGCKMAELYTGRLVTDLPKGKDDSCVVEVLSVGIGTGTGCRNGCRYWVWV